MLGDIVGYATVKDNPSSKINYPFGPVSDLAGKRLPVLERNRDGDCLCFVPPNGMADINSDDIVAFQATRR